ncbi:MAG: hypothetical protein IK076_06150, partial [Bacteroidales bacterium]|nr:hypothetical protein [Bacteroidales bacterium]
MGALGIDIGTSSISVALIGGKEDGPRSWTYPNDASVQGSPWERLQDPDRIVAKVLEIAAGLVGNEGDIRAIGLSGQMHGMLYVDGKGRAVSPLYTWEDGRGDLPCPDGSSWAGWLSAETGYKLSTGYGLVTHFYNLRNGLVPKEAARICTIMDYAAMALTGNPTPVMDPSDAASFGCFDLGSGAFDTAAIAKAGIDPSILPEVSPVSILGRFRGIPVVSAIGDNQASFLGSVRSKENSVHITVGTSSQISVFTDEYSQVPGLDTRPLPGGGYIIVGAALCGGSSLALLNRFLRGTARFLTGSEPDPGEVYSRMCEVASRTPEKSDLVVRTTFRGTSVDPSDLGSICNISFDNLNVEDVVLG